LYGRYYGKRAQRAYLILNQHDVLHEPVSLLDVTLDEKRPTSDSNLRRRHSVYDSPPVSEGTVLRRVASLTLDRNSAKRRRNSKSIIPQKTDCHKQFEGEIAGVDADEDRRC